MASTESLLSTKLANIGSTWHDLAQPRLNIGSGEAQIGAKMGQHAPKMGQHATTWPQMEPKRAPTSFNMVRDAASESPTCPQQGHKIVKYASVLLIFSIMSQNIVFPAVFAWFVAPSSAQDEPRWAPREPKMAQQGAKFGPRAPSWSQDEPNITPRCSKMGQPKPT